MNILIIGTGYVGITMILAFAEMGNRVTGYDTDREKVNRLNMGLLPIHEPELKETLSKHLQHNRIVFSADAEKSIQHNDVIFICVGTPARADGGANLRYIKLAAEQIGRYINGYKLVVIKSTAPVGTQQKMVRWISLAQIHYNNVLHPFDVSSNPEFLREGNALADALNPDRVIIGSTSKRATDILKTIYNKAACPVFITRPKEAELIKYASNAFLATKISFINELSRLCDKMGVDVREVASGMGMDKRIGSLFLKAGIGYGGSCFPKDVSALLWEASNQQISLSILEKVAEINRSQPIYLMARLKERLGGFSNRIIAVLGVSFKPDTDDIRESPAIGIIQKLLAEKAVVRVHDPVARVPAQLFDYGVEECVSPRLAAKDADAIVICTDWPQYSKLNWPQMKKIMKFPCILDGRNMLSAKTMRRIGFDYMGVGSR